jgi:hypothetical protein
MRSLLTHTAFASVLTLVGFVTTGCIEETMNIELQPDGSGKVQVERTLGKQLSGFLLMAPDGPRSNAAEAMAKWEGIEAWTDVKAGSTEDGRVTFKATGWFTDLSKVRQDSDRSSTSFELERSGGVLKVGVDAQQAEGGEEAGPGPGQQKKSLFEHPPEQLPMIKEMTKGMLSGMMGGFKTELNVVLPAAPSEVAGFTKDAENAQKVGMVHTGESIGKLIDVMFEEAEKIRPQVDAGELTVEEADAKLKEQMEGRIKTLFGPYSASCSVEGLGPDAAFTEAFAAAKKAWAESEWRAEVEQAKAEAAAEGEPGQPGQPGMGGEDDRKF